ncbi:hypothetical protein RWE15_23075 [Virgibacillus halophilus]|uniref:Uncharacterized protein n=1 Tax=Tigheibacillus halophilus TaxID=361280 RepID=A0ABU5CBM2_9BACI|nr:hypothetical protein [Virgibacillus halophilus]
MQSFLSPLQETIDSTIQWKLRDKMLELLQKFDIHDEHLQQLIQNLTLQYKEEDLKNQMKPGARLNGNYLLHYTNDVAADIKNKFRQLILPLIEEIGEMTEKQLENQVNELNLQKRSG